MTLPYLLRLLCLCLASFFLLHLALALAVSCFAPAAIRLAAGFRPRLAARFLLLLRLFPAGFAAFLVAGLCAPSYLVLEPEATAEHVGWACLGAAALGAAICTLSIARGLRATVRSAMYIRQCKLRGAEMSAPGESLSLLLVEGSAPFLGLAGLFRPRLLISRPVMSALSPDQLAAALLHERAHGMSRDNLKRLAILLAPGILPVWSGFAALEAAWARFAEWAADDRAVAANGRRSLSLAAALVRVARLGPAPQVSALMTSLLADGRDLSMRVERLLVATPPGEATEPGRPGLVAFAAVAPLATLMAILLQPASLNTAHRALEYLVR
jgi:Zn-dependent protease with chaperone function